MEPIKQLIQMTDPQYFRPSYQVADSQESFLAYLGQTRPRRSTQSPSEDSQLQLSPLARMVSGMSEEGRKALINLMEMVPEGQREQLGQLLESLVTKGNSQEMEPGIANLESLFNRILTSGNGEGQTNLSLSLRELSGLPVSSQRFFFESLDGFLNMSSRDLSAVLPGQNGLSKDEYNDFLKVLSNLLKRGVVGTEELRVRDQKQTTFVTTRLGDPVLRHARPYREQRFPLDDRKR